MGKSESVGSLGMGKAGGIEIHAHLLGLGPVDPVLEVARLDLVAIDLLVAELAVKTDRFCSCSLLSSETAFLKTIGRLGRSTRNTVSERGAFGPRSRNRQVL